MERVERAFEVLHEAAGVASACSPSSAECRLGSSTSGEQVGDSGQRTVWKREFYEKCVDQLKFREKVHGLNYEVVYPKLQRTVDCIFGEAEVEILVAAGVKVLDSAISEGVLDDACVAVGIVGEVLRAGCPQAQAAKARSTSAANVRPAASGASAMSSVVRPPVRPSIAFTGGAEVTTVNPALRRSAMKACS